MVCYKIHWKKSAEKELEKIDKKMISKIIARVEKLASDPRPMDSKKLAGSASSYRVRVGDYRILYDVIDEKVLIYIIRVRHRKDAYRDY